MQVCQKNTSTRDCYFEVTALLSETRRFIYGVKFYHNCVKNGENIAKRASAFPSSMSRSLKPLLIAIPTPEMIIQSRKAVQFKCTFPMPAKWRPEVIRVEPSTVAALEFEESSKKGCGNLARPLSQTQLKPTPHGIFTPGKESAYESTKAVNRSSEQKK